MNADDIYEALKRRHILPEWVLVRELRLGTGWDFGIWDDDGNYVRKAGIDHRIDAFALNCWASKKFMRIAYEIKVSRSDFMAEKRDPDKRAPACAISDYFYFAAPRGLIAPMELPKGTGLVAVYENGRSQILERAPKLEPTRLDWRFVASFARTLMKMQKNDFARDRFEPGEVR